MASSSTPTTASAQRRAVIYRRISTDATGEAAGVERQRKDCAAYCDRMGWSVIADLEDNDISASSYTRKRRPAYAEALRLLESGAADTLVAWHLDRLWRRPAELEHLIDLAERQQVTIATLNGEIDLRTGDGRFQARILVSVAAKASDDSSRRLRRLMDERAARGEPHGHRPFGWKPGGIGLDPVEAPVVAELVERFLAGETLSALARDLNTRGLVTPQTGRPWTRQVIRLMLANPRLAGLRVHRGQVVGPARWEPIIDVDTHRRVLAALDSPYRRKMTPPRRRLLTGLVRCGICDEVLTYGATLAACAECGALVSDARVRDGQACRDHPDSEVVKVPGKLRCVKQPGSRSCGGLTVRSAPLEELIVEAVLQRLDGGHLAAVLRRQAAGGKTDTVGAEIDQLEERQAELARLWAAGQMGQREWLAARQEIEARLEPLKAKHTAGAAMSAVPAALAAPGALRAAWPTLGLDQQRAILAMVIDRVVIAPATRRGPVFDPDRVDVRWRV